MPHDDVSSGSQTTRQPVRPGAAGSRLSRIQTFLEPSGNRWIVVVGAILWLLLMGPPGVADSARDGALVDWSWQACNGYFLQHHLHAGIDFVFPTWVLGYFYGGAYDRPLYWFYYAWQFLLAGCLSVSITHFALRFPRSSERLAVLIVSAIALTLLRADLLYFVLMLLAGSALLFSSSPRIERILPILLLLTTMSLVKFSFLSVAIIIVAFAALHSIVNSIVNHKVMLWALLLSPLLFALVFAGMWLLFRQHLTDLPTALRNEAAVSIGYNDAMGVSSRAITLYAGVIAFATFGLLLLKARKPGAFNPTSGIALLLFVALVLWKLGFVRSDAGHTGIFFGATLILTMLLPVYFGRHETQTLWHRRLSWACVAFCLGAIISSRGFSSMGASWIRQPFASAGFAFAPWRVQQQLEAKQSHLDAECDLPETRAIVGNAPVDVVSYDQEIALSNHLNLRPRPVYQGYSAYSTYLCSLNAAFYRGPQAPAYVLFKLQTIDVKFPTLDDSQIILELLRSYHPILAEKGYTLLARNVRLSVIARRQPRTYQVQLEQEITLADDAPCHLLELHTRGTAAGKIRAALLRPDNITIAIHLDDGEMIRYQMPPKMAETSVLLDPLLETSRDVVRLYAGLSCRRVHSFSLQSDHFTTTQKFEVILTPLDSVVGENLPPAQADLMLRQVK